MINPLALFRRPEYLFRPSQVLVRLRRLFCKEPPDYDSVRLPWGQVIKVRPRETIGSVIWYYGIFDLVVTEAICRLLDSGETALDIGANMGQMTSLMRYRAGASGRVISFEPHPILFNELAEIVRDGSGSCLAAAEPHRLGLSDHEGDACLELGHAWDLNRGLAKVVTGARTGSALAIQLTTLDRILPAATKVGVCKIDVEGHELAVFKGASRVLGEHRIRDIVFEDLGQHPSPTQQLLLDHGFSLFSLHTKLFGPCLVPLSREVQFGPIDGANFLATLDPARAELRFKRAGWCVLKGSRVQTAPSVS